MNLFETFFQSIRYNNMVDTKQIYFSRTFLKPWVHLFYNVAGVVGGTNRGDICIGKQKEIFFPVQ